MTVGEAVRKARKSKGFTLHKLAEKAGVSPMTISNAEKDRFYPSLLTMVSLADALEISLDELVGRTRR